MRFNNFWSYRRIIFSRRFLRTLWDSRRNVLADTAGHNPEAGPYMAEFDVTYRCNCRCRMCQRWNDPRIESLSVADYQRLAREFERMAVHQISIAGGEPLLRTDVFEIIAAFAQAGQSVNLCTNGMLIDRYRDEIADSGATCVTVSLDGSSAESHDAIRGVAGSYALIELGLQRLLAVPRRRRPIVRVRMTVSGLNQGEIRQFYQRWHDVADDVLLQPIHHCGDAFYTGMTEADRNLDAVILRDQIAGTPLARDGYMRRFVASLEKNSAYPFVRCYAGVLMARIDPWGNVYPCLEQHVRIGSIKENTFYEVWRSPSFQRERDRLRTGRSCRCWYNNTALIGFYGDRLRRTSIRHRRV
jgi:MoaA/NifB/PqqE/SkfB family radical SAM enzyme